MTVVRESSGKRRSIVESELGLVFGELELLLEGIDVVPELENFLFLLGEVGSFGYCATKIKA